jgi:RNA-directed DNA polymerase
MSLKHVRNIHELAWQLGCSAKQLGYYLYKRPIPNQYKTFEIPKKRGGARKISAPSSNLKLIQKSLYREFAEMKTFKPCVNGFVTGRDIARNARPHVGHRHLLNVDLEDFFGSINYGRVYGLLSSSPFNLPKAVAAAITKACILDNKLPQGAPTSPIISNMICSRMDSELSKLAKSHGCIYTRYADDLTFSSRTRPIALATRERQADGTYSYGVSTTLATIIEANGFRINFSKIRMSSREHRQEVTGLIVNKRLNVKRRLVREVRAMLHAWRKFGQSAAEDHFKKKYNGGTKDFESAVRGKSLLLAKSEGVQILSLGPLQASLTS